MCVEDKAVAKALCSLKGAWAFPSGWWSNSAARGPPLTGTVQRRGSSDVSWLPALCAVRLWAAREGGLMLSGTSRCDFWLQNGVCELTRVPLAWSLPSRRAGWWCWWKKLGARAELGLLAGRCWMCCGKPVGPAVPLQCQHVVIDLFLLPSGISGGESQKQLILSLLSQLLPSAVGFAWILSEMWKGKG